MGENSRLFMASIIKNVIPLAGQYLEHKIDENVMNRTHKMNMEKLNKQEQLLGLQKNMAVSTASIPTFQFEEGEDVDDLGRKMWGTFHQATLSIPDDAKPHEVRKVMRDIERSIKKHPCGECRENAKENLKEVPLTKGVKTKKDAVKRMYEFHEKVNRELGKPKFEIEDFEREYNFKLDDSSE